MLGGQRKRRRTALARALFIGLVLLAVGAGGAAAQTPTPRPAKVVVGSTNALAGTDVDIPIVLDPGDQNVFGVQNDILSDLITPVGVIAPGGPPDCVANGALNFSTATFVCLNPDCLRIRALLKRQVGGPLPAGILYTCTYSVDPAAMPSVHPLNALSVSMTGNVGQTVPSSSVDGVINVVLELPPTSTPTATRTVTATATETLTPTETLTITIGPSPTS